MVARLLHLFSHGMSEWLLQRLTALLMAVYMAVLVVVLLTLRPDGYQAWHGLFDSALMKIATFTFMLSLLLHAWVGVQAVLSDYVKHVHVRRMLKLAAAAILVVLGSWSLWILWGNAS